MRILLSILLIAVLAISLQAQRNADRLINTIKKQESSVTVKVPGWLIAKGVRLALKEDYDEDLAVWQQMADDIKQVRVSVVESNEGRLDEAKIRSHLAKIKGEDNYETYASVRDGATNIEVLVREVEGRVKNVLLYIHGDGTVGAIHVKSNIDLTTFQQAPFSWQDNKT